MLKERNLRISYTHNTSQTASSETPMRVYLPYL